MNFTRLLTLICFAAILGVPSKGKAQYDEKYRPQYHFTPNSNWIGDPDGLVKYNGKYHLFWWGHAYSTDLVHWTELPYPIHGDPAPYNVTTGSAVIDKNNVSGLGTNSMVAFHTLAGSNDQRIGISSGTTVSDNFTNLALYSGNPIINPSPVTPDFRDPQVFWYPDSSRWVMAIAKGTASKIEFYKSTNLKSWTYTGVFSREGGNSGDMWETPDLFQLPVDGNPAVKKWVLSVAIFPNKMRYFIGSFNGTTFVNDYPGKQLTMDLGKDFYAARTWRDYDSVQTGAKILGWMGNWDYSTVAPSKLTYNGLGVQSLPRDLALKTYPEGIRLVQTPIANLNGLRTGAVSFSNKAIAGTNAITSYGAFSPSQNVYEMKATFKVRPNATFGFNLCVNNSLSKKLVVRYTTNDSMLTIDRTNTADVAFDPDFSSSWSGKVSPVGNKLELRFYVDKSSVEIFANDGKEVFSILTYAGDNQNGIEVFSGSGTDSLLSFSGWTMQSIWPSGYGYRVDSGFVYKIENRGTGKVLDSDGSANLTQLQQWAWLNGSNQKWKVEVVEQGYFLGGDWIPTYYKFTNMFNSKVLDLRGGTNTNGTVVQQYDWSNNNNQKWSLEDVGGGYYKIVSKASSRDQYHKVLEVESGSTSNGAKIQMWTFFGYPHQEWKFTSTGSSARLAAETPGVKPKSNYTIYPNPASSSIVVKGNTGYNLIDRITITAMNGGIAKTVEGLDGQASCTIPTSDLRAGVYMISVYDGTKMENHQINIL